MIKRNPPKQSEELMLSRSNKSSEQSVMNLFVFYLLSVCICFLQFKCVDQNNCWGQYSMSLWHKTVI